jgi:hypothetical protein
MELFEKSLDIFSLGSVARNTGAKRFGSSRKRHFGDPAATSLVEPFHKDRKGHGPIFERGVNETYNG